MVEPDSPKKTVNIMSVACKLAQKTKYSISCVQTALKAFMIHGNNKKNRKNYGAKAHYVLQTRKLPDTLNYVL